MTNDFDRSVLQGKKFCITGPLHAGTRDFYIDYIKENGGIYSKSVTKDLNYLITNQPRIYSEKMKKAIKYNIQIIDENHFRKIFIEKGKKIRAILNAAREKKLKNS